MSENIFILMPFYNRKKFIPLIIHNIKKQKYSHDKLSLIIDDDSEEKLNEEEINLIKDSISPVKLVYIKSQRKTIGKKRNDLCKYIMKNHGKKAIVANMDTDDFYSEDYISYSYDMLIKNKVHLVGSSSMLFAYPYHDYKMSFIKCNNKDLIHEASMLYRLNFWRSGGYDNNMTGEAKKLIKGYNHDLVYDSNIHKVMICIAHRENTIDKEQFLKNDIPFLLDIKDRVIIDKCL